MSVVRSSRLGVALLLAVLAATFGCGSTKIEYRAVAAGGTGGIDGADGGARALGIAADGGEAGLATPP